MGATLSQACLACKGRHELFLPHAHTTNAAKRYGYICPTTQQPASYDSNHADWWKTVEVKPQDAVVLSEV